MTHELLEALKVSGNNGDDIEAAIKSTIEPLERKREELREAIAQVETVKRDLEAQVDRLDRMLDAARMRKRPGRKPGAKPREAAAA